MRGKLLILGGNMLSVDIVKAAKDMGLYTIVTDWNSTEKSPAKKVADEYWNTSILDYSELKKRMDEQHIDGIMTGFTDSYLLPYQHLCEIAGKPCYATKEVLEQTLDKSRFKAMCRRNGVPVVPEYQLREFNPECISHDNKVIIKPVDNSGSRGIVVCDNPQDFDSCLQLSLIHI